MDGVYPRSVADALGLKVFNDGLVASTTRQPSAREQEQAQAGIDDVSRYTWLGVESGPPHQSPIGLLALVIAAGAVTLGGTFTVVGLAAAEGRADVSTLAAVGAGPGVRRRLAAAQAAVITLLGAALGLCTGLLAGWALVRLHGPSVDTPVEDLWSGTVVSYRNWPFAVSWLEVLALTVGVPLLAIALAFVTTRSRLPLVRRPDQ
jgi:putative ABC transport system permease protein